MGVKPVTVMMYVERGKLILANPAKFMISARSIVELVASRRPKRNPGSVEKSTHSVRIPDSMIDRVIEVGRGLGMNASMVAEIAIGEWLDRNDVSHRK